MLIVPINASARPNAGRADVVIVSILLAAIDSPPGGESRGILLDGRRIDASKDAALSWLRGIGLLRRGNLLRGSRKALILFGIFVAGASAAADTAGREEWVNKVAEDYAGVSAGVEINKRCSILSRAESEVLERDLGAFTKALRGKTNPEFLSMIRETSGTMAAEDPYDSCGGEARQAVADARELVDWWLIELKATEQ